MKPKHISPAERDRMAKCPHCDEIIFTEDKLCPVRDAWECSDCGEIYEDKDDAEECCGE